MHGAIICTVRSYMHRLIESATLDFCFEFDLKRGGGSSRRQLVIDTCRVNLE